jgi:histidinol-phosphate aminotransferase
VDLGDLIRPVVLKMPAYVPGKPIEELERELGIHGAIKMASNENPLGPSPRVLAAVAEAARGAALYPDANAFELRKAIAAFHGVASGRVLPGNGLDDVLRILAETFFRPGDEVVVPDPTFSVYGSVALLVDAVPVPVRARAGWGNDLDAMRDAVTERTRAVFVCNPNNPTGTFVARAELERFVEALPPRVLVVVDEAYADFADDPDFPRALELVKAGGRRVVLLKTFSKLHGMAGLRLGYAVADEAIIAATLKVKDPFNANALAQAAGIAALSSAEHQERSRELVRSGRRRFYEGLARLGIDYLPTQANFILLDLKRDSRPMYDFLLRGGVIVRPTHSFGLPTCLRITFGLPEHNERFFALFEEGLKAGL